MDWKTLFERERAERHATQGNKLAILICELSSDVLPRVSSRKTRIMKRTHRLVHSKRHRYPPACCLGYWQIHAISVGRGANAPATFGELFARK